MLDLETIVTDFAEGLIAADARRPQAINVRSKKPFLPGIGPHTEADTIRLIAAEVTSRHPSRYEGKIALSIPYPDAPRQKCDLCVGPAGAWQWAIEAKMLRMLGDNGKVNDNILMHILSPYPAHRSALTDCLKLSQSAFAPNRAILIYGYEDDEWPLEPAIAAFEVLASATVPLRARKMATFDGLIHPIHTKGKVFAWEIE